MPLTGFPADASGKEPACQCRRHKRHRFNLWARKILWRRGWQPTPVFLPGESHDRGAWRATVHRIAKRHNWSDLALTLSLSVSLSPPPPSLPPLPPPSLPHRSPALGKPAARLHPEEVHLELLSLLQQPSLPYQVRESTTWTWVLQRQASLQSNTQRPWIRTIQPGNPWVPNPQIQCEIANVPCLNLLLVRIMLCKIR